MEDLIGWWFYKNSVKHIDNFLHQSMGYIQNFFHLGLCIISESVMHVRFINTHALDPFSGALTEFAPWHYRHKWKMRDETGEGLTKLTRR